MFSEDVWAQSPPQPGPKTVNLEKWKRTWEEGTFFPRTSMQDLQQANNIKNSFIEYYRIVQGNMKPW